MLSSELLATVIVLLGLCLGVSSLDSILGPPSTDPACANPPVNQCSFYANCLESRYHCGASGYPLGYGQYSCQKFADNLDLFDLLGQRWVNDTRLCLQRALVGDAIDDAPPSLTCQALEEEAFAARMNCYISYGFCSLSTTDWAAVLDIVNITTVASNLDVMVELQADCAQFYTFVETTGLPF